MALCQPFGLSGPLSIKLYSTLLVGTQITFALTGSGFSFNDTSRLSTDSCTGSTGYSHIHMISLLGLLAYSVILSVTFC